MSWCFASWALHVILVKSVAVFRVKIYSEIIQSLCSELKLIQKLFQKQLTTLKLFTHFQSENESRKSMTAALFYSVHASHTAVSTAESDVELEPQRREVFHLQLI